MSTITTPPPTTLSGPPSPTELPSYKTGVNDTTVMPAPSSLQSPIYLIVATSTRPPLGIGLRDALPWAPIRADMAFFRRVTSRLPPPPPSTMAGDGASGAAGAQGRKNVVIMGRKTWDSIPAMFRPLPGRLNVVVSRSLRQVEDLGVGKEKGVGRKGNSVLLARGVGEALDMLSAMEQRGLVGKVWVIGGAEIYKGTVHELHGRGEKVRAVQTQLRRKDNGEVECDTFFPLELEIKHGIIRRVEDNEVEEWVGEEVLQGRKAEKEQKVVDIDDSGGSKVRWLEDGDVQLRTVGWEIGPQSINI